MSANHLDSTHTATSTCAFCPKMCRSSCAVAEAESRETVTPHAKMTLVQLATERVATLSDASPSKVIQACTGCGACTSNCAHENPVADTLFAARALGKTERSSRIRDNFVRSGDAKGRDLWPQHERLPRSTYADTAYFAGCTRLAEQPQQLDKDRRALAIALGQEIPACSMGQGALCCGYPLYADGQWEVLTAHLQKLEKHFDGFETVITPDPGCAYVLSVVRRALLGEKSDEKWPDVLPLVEILAMRAEMFRDNAKGLTVQYHDPCYLGRHSGSYTAPRTLITAATGVPPVEFVRNREAADCAGGGGLYPMSNPDGALKAAKKRAFDDDTYKMTHAVVTACPTAQRGLQKAGALCIDIVDVALGELDTDFWRKFFAQRAPQMTSLLHVYQQTVVSEGTENPENLAPVAPADDQSLEKQKADSASWDASSSGISSDVGGETEEVSPILIPLRTRERPTT